MIASEIEIGQLVVDKYGNEYMTKTLAYNPHWNTIDTYVQVFYYDKILLFKIDELFLPTKKEIRWYKKGKFVKDDTIS